MQYPGTQRLWKTACNTQGMFTTQIIKFKRTDIIIITDIITDIIIIQDLGSILSSYIDYHKLYRLKFSVDFGTQKSDVI